MLYVFYYSSDMEIHVSTIGSSKTTVLTGHKASILGVALDPKDKYVVSSLNLLFLLGSFVGPAVFVQYVCLSFCNFVL
jgi:hypothetical protein